MYNICQLDHKGISQVIKVANRLNMMISTLSLKPYGENGYMMSIKWVVSQLSFNDTKVIAETVYI